MKIAIVLLLLGGGGYAVWTQFFKPEPPAQLTTAPVARGTVEETVLASGIIEAQQLISVGARVSGQVDTLAVTLGQQVQEGDLIAQIDNQDQQNDVLEAKADLAQIEAQIAANEANLRKAQLLLERAEKLQAQNYTSQVDVESATADVQVYKADLAALAAQKDKAEVTVSTAQIALDRTRITAPITGTVVAIVVNEGQTVNANTDAPTIVKLANLDQMVVKAEISEADVVHVRAGQEVRFTILGEPEQQFTATVRDVEPAPSEIKDSDTISTDEAIYYNGLFDVENPDHTLRIGMTTQVSIVLDRAEGVLTLPAAALKGSARSGYTVQVVDSATGAPRSVAVEVGLNNKVTAQITSGLSEGDRVVTGAAVAAASSTSSSRGGPPPMGF
ncbi:efflux RND transporter periplasmic adaptor subunit [Pseudooceanicola nanhaiensis]|uniref:efflux RND transporter periplasmic adaptor subunit n=1 Tax=Pseudooceanicola nanhaiensis TaxID=375761 RepID=UPI001CD4E913|nr:efflux RND transporter periplasmic adaptor subunit [Pseudooceanicola nanhaiensis]MCA0922367.1 efflux RND transporter periplasmic adaptor subunit [Pseudooceanicola nanhaiensis]